MTDKAEYREYVKKNAPKSPMWRSLIAAFVVGGLICCVGQGVHDGVEALSPALTEEEKEALNGIMEKIDTRIDEIIAEYSKEDS